MAKKAVATFAAKAGAKSMVKCIRMEKSPKTGAYVFTEQLVEESKVKEYFIHRWVRDGWIVKVNNNQWEKKK